MAELLRSAWGVAAAEWGGHHFWKAIQEAPGWLGDDGEIPIVHQFIHLYDSELITEHVFFCYILLSSFWHGSIGPNGVRNLKRTDEPQFWVWGVGMSETWDCGLSVDLSLFQDELIDRVHALKRQSLINFWKISGEDMQWTEHLGSGVMRVGHVSPQDVTGVLWSCNLAKMVSERCRPPTFFHSCTGQSCKMSIVHCTSI